MDGFGMVLLSKVYKTKIEPVELNGTFISFQMRLDPVLPPLITDIN